MITYQNFKNFMSRFRSNKTTALTILISFLTLAINTGATAAKVASATQPVATKHVFGVHGLACPFCAVGVKKTFNKVKGVQSVKVSLKNKTVTVYTHKGVCFSKKELKALFAKTGFSYHGTLVKPKSCK